MVVVWLVALTDSARDKSRGVLQVLIRSSGLTEGKLGGPFSGPRFSSVLLTWGEHALLHAQLLSLCTASERPDRAPGTVSGGVEQPNSRAVIGPTPTADPLWCWL